MKPKLTERQSIQIGQEKILSLVSSMLGGYGRPSDDDTTPIHWGPWGPVMRNALERSNIFFGSHPEPWKSVLRQYPETLVAITNVQRSGAEVELNLQPLPPRTAFLVSLAQTVIDRVELIHEISNAIRSEGGKSNSALGYLNSFIDDPDDWCPTPLIGRFPGRRHIGLTGT